MKNKDLFKAMNGIDPQLIEEADQVKTRKIKAPWTKWAAVAACFCLCALIGFGVWQGGVIGNENPETTVPGTVEVTYTDKYIYKVDEGPFSSYVGGKVIAEDKIGAKISDVTLTAGWKDLTKNEWLTEEKLRGEVYTIHGIANDVAVALKFIDKGDAVTTTHYYVIMNPDADLSAVEEYIIGSNSSKKPSNPTSGVVSTDGCVFWETTVSYTRPL